MSNLWLNPALLRQARDGTSSPFSGGFAPDAFDDFDGPGSQEASGLAGDMPQRGRQPTAAVRRGRRASRRRLCLRLATLALLGGSAAFSYVAWSDEMRGERAHTVPGPTGR